MWPDWQAKALCRGNTPEWDLFFGEDSGKRVTHTEEAIAVAKSICDLCPVSDECLEYADEFNIKYGIWGGKTPQERMEESDDGSELRQAERN